VYARRATEVRSADDLGALDPAAIRRVREEAWPVASTADELYDALMVAGYLLDGEITPRWRELLGELGLRTVRKDGRWHAVERKDDAPKSSRQAAWKFSARSRKKRIRCFSSWKRKANPARPLHSRHERARMVPSAAARGIHRYTLNRLRSEIEPVTAADFTRFLLHWQHVAVASS